ncbi:sulfite exporter TauE/SafE family protein [Magnetospirillum moscoviense]|uniref:Probable membrane transporter protein n=1 Tax=Magnetospirillum moscoviense TaxID=1437059 RepID=A0A178MZY4_9PROT|nr:sulfite exporter TauE/SafE family protein [Magnetospirillum moscoviense]MBF0325461.1 sulfite exporter TauE/SafE family protein [Alphaproteobacteria bacterium]OAN55710.1 permease [Magnetospirillum moscoviense]
MNIYLPIAAIPVDLLTLLALGGGVGFLSGLFGVGGGFLLTPFLMFLGVPAPVAVATGANQVVGASVSGLIVHWRRRTVDLRMGLMLLAGGFAGSSGGIWLFAWLKSLGQIDLVIALSYVLFLGFIGTTMAAESVQALLRKPGSQALRKRHRHIGTSLPFKMRFSRSGLYISALLPIAVGAFGGLLAAIMGVGGGFVMVPLMIYVLEMPTAVVIGTSLFQIIFVTANVTFLQAVGTHTVDAVLMLTLLVGGVVGAQIGAKFGDRLRAETLRLLLALIVLGVCFKLGLDLASTPSDLFAMD